MRLRPILLTTAAVLAAAALGVGGGYAAGRMDKPSPEPAPHPATLTAAAPLPALPELDVAKPRPYNTDTDYPALATNLPYTPERAHGGGHVWAYKVPKGWISTPGNATDPPATVRWRPAGETAEDRGYLLRIVPIAGTDTPSDKVEIRKQKMSATYDDVTVKHQDGDSVWFIYRTEEDYKRFNYFAWVAAGKSPYAGFELSVAGRDADQAGLAELLTKVKNSVRLIR